MKNGWFGQSRSGAGIIPVRWQGWVVAVTMTLGLSFGLRWVAPILGRVTFIPTLLWIVIGAFVAIGAFAGVVALTYDDDRD
jgi:hypothetical protein